MKMRNVLYWISTVLVAVLYVFGGVSQVVRSPQSVQGVVQHLGYPMHFLVLLGVWKILGGVAIVAPRFPRLKEWAYAGMVFDSTGAAVAIAAVGDPVLNIVAPLVMTGIIAVSWALRPETRRLKAA